MNEDLRAAVTRALRHVDIEIDPSRFDEREEYARLREMREMGMYPQLAARLAVLIVLGWKRNDLSEGLDVTRVTINNWLSAHTSRSSTFDEAIERDDSVVLTRALNKLNPRAAQIAAGVRFTHDKFVVPDGFVPTINALWRVAYRSRGAELTTNPEISAASDALDVVISLMLRRGVTNVAIANAAGVTHRAVLDRMHRARVRGLLLVCDEIDDACESFYGENDVKQLYGPIGVAPGSRKIDTDAWLPVASPLSPLWVPVRVTSPNPSQYWLQTLVNDASGTPMLLSLPSLGIKSGERDPAIAQQTTTMHLAGLTSLEDQVSIDWHSLSEIGVAAMIGRMNEQSEVAISVASNRDRVMFVRSDLLYTESAQNAGMTPHNIYGVVPDGIKERFIEPFELVLRCFSNPDEVIEEYSPITKHDALAGTRSHAS